MRDWIRRHRLLAAAISTVSAVIVVTADTNIWVRADASAHEYSTADTPNAPVALVLGAGLKADGTPSRYLQDRLDDALALYRGGKITALLVSGDNGTATHDEPTAMMDYLVAHGRSGSAGGARLCRFRHL